MEENLKDLDLELEEEKEDKKKDKKKKKEMVSLEEYNKIQDMYAKALNTAAYHENLSKYYQKEYDKMMKYRSQNVIESLLPTLDGFELAFRFEAKTEEAKNYRVGFEFVYKLLKDALGNEGVVEITPKVGEVFDASKHQAVDKEETSDEKLVNTIKEVMLNGYYLKDRIIRPANVKIYVKKEEKVEVESTKEEN
ncbi:MAG: nucleotide exchange factor GrpE [Bacilli bacterium]|nr:nucleotide exchange factor GrpE [Bacilli bacterium]